MTKHKQLAALFQARTGKTIYIPKETDNPAKLTAYFRDRTDLSTLPDVRRWR